jgi:hypothetical protein
MVLGALAVGCGDDSGGGNGGGVDSGTLLDAGGGGGGDAGGGGGSAAPGPLSDFSGTLVSILAVDTSLKIETPHLVELLNPTTGKPYIPTISGMTAQGTGTITLKAPPDPLMLWIHGVGDETYDTVINGQRRNSGDMLLRISSAGTSMSAAATGGFTARPDRAAATVTIYWSQNGLRKGTIGCAKYYLDGQTTNDASQDQLYSAGSGLPVPLAKQSQTLTSGRTYIANATIGTHKMKVSLDDGKTFIGQELSFVVPFSRAEASSNTKAVLVQFGFDVEGDKNPTPAGCVDPTTM